MNDNEFTIFVVDDDPVSRMILTDEISVLGYEVYEFSNGKECLDSMEKHPDLVLMDVEMPVMNGYEACRQIKSKSETVDTSVIFISSHDTMDEKLEGYAAGGSDYVIKPVQPAELMQKVAVALKNIKRTSEARSAIEAADIVKNDAGEQQVLMDFMRRSFMIDDVDSLGDLVVESFGDFGVESTVQIRSSVGEKNYSSKGLISPLEMELLDRMKESGAIPETEERLIANFGSFSILIKNMPDDVCKNNHLRDLMGVLLEAAEAKLKSLEIERGLSQVTVESNAVMKKIKSAHEHQKEIVVSIMDKTTADLEASISQFGLTGVQLEAMMKIVQDGVGHSLDEFEEFLKADKELENVVARINSVSEYF